MAHRDVTCRGNREEEGEPVRKDKSIRFGLGTENERADAGRDSRTCFARSSYQALDQTARRQAKLLGAKPNC